MYPLRACLRALLVATALVCAPPASAQDGGVDEARVAPATPGSAASDSDAGRPAADTPSPRLIREPIEGERGAAEISERREVPDYDGRPAPATSAGRKLLWFPRIVLSPLYAVNEFVVRRPLRAVALWGEENRVGSKISNVFTLGTGGRAGILPTALFDFGLRPSVGLYFFADDAPRAGDRFGLHFAYGGDEWWRVSVRERFLLDRSSTARNTELSAKRISLHFVFDQRPDHLIAERTLVEDQDVYAFKWTRLGGAVDLELPFGALDGVSIGVGAYRNRFGDGDGDIERANGGSVFAIAGSSPTPRATTEAILDGFEGYISTELQVAVTLDSRDPDTANPGSGVRLRLWSELGYSPDFGDGWTNHGAKLGFFGDVNGHRRVVSLVQRLEVGNGFTSDAPFTELPMLGGNEGLRGFSEGRVRAPVTWLSTLQYSYPIWVFMDGFVFYEIGNGYDDLAALNASDLASSFGIGIRSNANRDSAFSLMVGAGTTPFSADTYAVESLRILVGAQRGF